MIQRIVKKIASELERYAQANISVERALDLIEAATDRLDELVAINTMRESLYEIEKKPLPKTLYPAPEMMSMETGTTFLPS